MLDIEVLRNRCFLSNTDVLLCFYIGQKSDCKVDFMNGYIKKVC